MISSPLPTSGASVPSSPTSPHPPSVRPLPSSSDSPAAAARAICASPSRPHRSSSPDRKPLAHSPPRRSRSPVPQRRKTSSATHCSVHISAELAATLPNHLTVTGLDVEDAVEGRLHLPAFFGTRCDACRHDHTSQFTVPPDTADVLMDFPRLRDLSSTYSSYATTITSIHQHPPHALAFAHELWTPALLRLMEESSRYTSTSMSTCRHFNIVTFPSEETLERQAMLHNGIILGEATHIMVDTETVIPQNSITSLLSPGHIYLVAVSDLPTDFSDLKDEISRYDIHQRCQHKVDPTSPQTITFKFPDTALLNRVYSDTHIGILRTYAHCYAISASKVSTTFNTKPTGVAFPHRLVTPSAFTMWFPSRRGVAVNGPLPEHLNPAYLQSRWATADTVDNFPRQLFEHESFVLLLLADSLAEVRRALVRLFNYRKVQVAPIPLNLLPDQLPAHPDQCPTTTFYPFLVGHLVHNPKRPHLSGTDLSLFKPKHELIIKARNFYSQTLHSAAKAILPLLQHMDHVHPYRELLLIASSPDEDLANIIAASIAVNNSLNTIEAAGRLLTVVSMTRFTATLPLRATYSRISAIVFPSVPSVIEVANPLQPALLPPISDLVALGSLVTTIDAQNGLPTSLTGPASILRVARGILNTHFNLLIAPLPSTPSDNDHVTVTLSLNNRPLGTSLAPPHPT